MNSHLLALARIRNLCSFTVAGIWIFQGLVPKLLGPHPDELAMSAAFGIEPALQAPISHAVGAMEIAFGICILLIRTRAWPQLLSAAGTAVLLVFVAIFTPGFLFGAFNPVVMNLASIALSIVGVLALRAEQSNAA